MCLRLQYDRNCNGVGLLYCIRVSSGLWFIFSSSHEVSHLLALLLDYKSILCTHPSSGLTPIWFSDAIEEEEEEEEDTRLASAVNGIP